MIDDRAVSSEDTYDLIRIYRRIKKFQANPCQIYSHLLKNTNVCKMLSKHAVIKSTRLIYRFARYRQLMSAEILVMEKGIVFVYLLFLEHHPKLWLENKQTIQFLLPEFNIHIYIWTTYVLYRGRSRLQQSSQLGVTFFPRKTQIYNLKHIIMNPPFFVNHHFI